MVLFLSKDEPGAAARLLVEYTKKFERLEVKALALDGQLLGPAQLQAVASLPSRHEALSQLAAVLLAPVTKLVRTVNEPVAQFVRVMGQIRDQKQA
jgi:large subunit ribosomal protein L10